MELEVAQNAKVHKQLKHKYTILCSTWRLQRLWGKEKQCSNGGINSSSFNLMTTVWLLGRRMYWGHIHGTQMEYPPNLWNLVESDSPLGFSHARWQQKPQFSLPPPPRLGCWWCQCRTWVWLVWWQWSGHWHSMESSAFVSSSCWTLMPMVSAALQAMKSTDDDQYVSGPSVFEFWRENAYSRAIQSYPHFFFLHKSRTSGRDLRAPFRDTPVFAWYMMMHLDRPWYPQL